MRISLSTHAVDRIQQRVGMVNIPDVVDVTNAIYTRKYRHLNTNNNITHYVVAYKKHPVVLVVDTTEKRCVTAMTSGDSYAKDVRKAMAILKKAA